MQQDCCWTSSQGTPCRLLIIVISIDLFAAGRRMRLCAQDRRVLTITSQARRRPRLSLARLFVGCLIHRGIFRLDKQWASGWERGRESLLHSHSTLDTRLDFFSGPALYTLRVSRPNRAAHVEFFVLPGGSTVHYQACGRIRVVSGVGRRESIKRNHSTRLKERGWVRKLFTSFYVQTCHQ